MDQLVVHIRFSKVALGKRLNSSRFLSAILQVPDYHMYLQESHG